MSVFYNSSTNSKLSPNKTSLNKKRLTQDQVKLLEASFNCNKKLDPQLKIHLALQLGIPTRQIAIWYQNKRARWKSQSLELDYSALRLKLDTILSEKQQLEKEITQLRSELHKAKDALILKLQGGGGDGDYMPPPVSPFSSGGGGGGGSTSSLHDDVISCCWENGRPDYQALRLEELYACLMGDEDEGYMDLSLSSIPQKREILLI